MNLSGNMAPAEDMFDVIKSSVEGAVSYLDDADQKSLYLLACEGATVPGPGELATGQLLADHLDRPVVAYHSTISVAPLKDIEKPLNSTYGINNNHINAIFDATPTPGELAQRYQEIDRGIGPKGWTQFSIKGPARDQRFLPGG